MTVIRLPNTSDLVVYSPFDPDLVDLSPLGTVRAIIAPNSIHDSYPQRFLECHPGAVLYSSPELQKRCPERNWGTILHESVRPDIISPHVLVKPVTGTPMQEIVLFHVPSGSVLVADLAFNLTPALLARAPIGGRLFYRYASMVNLNVHLWMRSWMRPQCSEALPQLTALIEDWDWDRLIPCHGDVAHCGAKQAFRDGTYRFVVDSAVRKEWSSGQLFMIAAVGIGIATAVGVYFANMRVLK